MLVRCHRANFVDLMPGRANTAGTGHSQRTHVRKHITDDFVAVFNFRLSLESLDPARASCEATI